MRSDEKAVTTYFPFMGIEPGSRVTIRTPRGQERTGTAVMRSSENGRPRWVLNMGGAHGRTALASMKNTVRVEPPKGDSKAYRILNGGG